MVTAEQFVTTWQQASSAAEAAKRLRVPVNTATSRAFRYRKLGIPLKRMPRGGNTAHLDLAALSHLAQRVARNGKGRRA